MDPARAALIAELRRLDAADRFTDLFRLGVAALGDDAHRAARWFEATAAIVKRWLAGDVVPAAAATILQWLADDLERTG